MGFNMARTCCPWRRPVGMGFQAGSCHSTCVRHFLSAHVQQDMNRNFFIDPSRLSVRRSGNEKQSTTLKQGDSGHLYFLVWLVLRTLRQRRHTCGQILRILATVTGQAVAAITSTYPIRFCTPGKQTSFSNNLSEIDVMPSACNRLSLFASLISLSWFLTAHILEYTSTNTCRHTSPHLWWLTFGILCILYLMILEIFLLGILVFILGPIIYVRSSSVPTLHAVT